MIAQTAVFCCCGLLATACAAALWTGTRRRHLPQPGSGLTVEGRLMDLRLSGFEVRTEPFGHGPPALAPGEMDATAFGDPERVIVRHRPPASDTDMGLLHDIEWDDLQRWIEEQTS